MNVNDTLDLVSKYSNHVDALYAKGKHISTDEFSKFKASVHTACVEIINDLMDANPFDDGELIVEQVMMRYYHVRCKSSVKEASLVFFECEYVCKRILFWIKYINEISSKEDEFKIYKKEKEMLKNELQGVHK